MERPFPAYQGPDRYVFVSYSHADMGVVFPEIVWMHEAGVPVWYDEGIGAGTSWRDEVANALAGCDTFVFFVTPNAVKSDHCLQELNFALSKRRKVLTIHVEPTKFNIGLEMTLGDRQAIIRGDFAENRYREKVLEALKLPRPSAIKTGGTPAEADASARQPSQGPGLLVAPFRHVGTHEFSQSLAESLPDAIANGLAQFEEHTIIDPTAVSSRTSAETIRTTAQDLGASWVLDGQIQAAGGKVRVIAHIAAVDTGIRTWSQTFDRMVDDVFELEDELVAIIVSTVGEAIHEMTSDALAGKPQGAWNGFDYVLRGIELLHRIDPEENAAARRCFDTALEIEPGTPLALICRCWTYYFEVAMGWPTSRDDGLAYCIDTIRKLFVKNDRSAHGHRLISRCLHNAGQHVEALKHSKRAYELNPFDTDMIMNLSLSMSACGEDPEHAVALGERAVALNPYAPPTFPAHLSLAYFTAGRHVDVVNTIDSMARPVANGDLHRIASLVLMNETEKAREAMASALDARPYLNREIAAASVMLAEGPNRKRYLDSLAEAGLPYR